MNIQDFRRLEPKERSRRMHKISVIPILHEALRRMDTSQVQRANVRPSMIGSGSGDVSGYKIGCPRMLWYAYFGTEQAPQTVASKSRTLIGKAFHLVLQELLEQAAKFELLDVYLEHEVWEEYDLWTISGSIDGLVTLPDGTRFVLEIKSIDPPSFHKLTRPHDYHLTQAHMYMRLADVPLGIILYVEVSPYFNLAEFPFMWDDERWEAIEYRLSQVADHVMKGTLPPAEGSFMYCTSWCPYRHVCEKGGSDAGQGRTEAPGDGPERRGPDRRAGAEGAEDRHVSASRETTDPAQCRGAHWNTASRAPRPAHSLQKFRLNPVRSGEGQAESVRERDGDDLVGNPPAASRGDS